MPAAGLLGRHASEWRRAMRPLFLDAVRDGALPAVAFDTWLVQDARFVAGLLPLQARLPARAARPAQAVLAVGGVLVRNRRPWAAGVPGTAVG